MITLLLSLAMFNSNITQTQDVLSDFSKMAEIENWTIINDGVMGGKSQGKFKTTENGTAIFKGDVSLKNNGGFTSIRYSFQNKNISGSTKVLIKLKGDKKKYQFRVKNQLTYRHAYKYEFSTIGNWQTIVIPLNEMVPTFRGVRPNLPNYKAEILSEIGFLISNKKNESFNLEIAKIWLQ